MEAPRGVTFGPDGSTFAVPDDPSGVTIRDVDTGEVLKRLVGHDATITDMAFSPEGTRLAGAAGAGIGDVQANRTMPIWDVRTGKLVMTLTGHRDQTTAVEFSPDGRRLVTSSYDGTLRVWDAATGEQQRSLQVGADAYALAFTPDGRFLVAGIGCDGVVTVFDANTLKRVRELRGHTDCAQDVAFAAGGWAVTVSWDGTAKIWDLVSGREVVTLRGHTGAVLGVGGQSRWESHRRRQRGRHREIVGCGHWTRDPHAVRARANRPQRRVPTAVFWPPPARTARWHFTSSRSTSLRALARERVTRTLTDEECRQYLHLASCPS